MKGPSSPKFGYLPLSPVANTSASPRAASSAAALPGKIRPFSLPPRIDDSFLKQAFHGIYHYHLDDDDDPYRNPMPRQFFHQEPTPEHLHNRDILKNLAEQAGCPIDWTYHLEMDKLFTPFEKIPEEQHALVLEALKLLCNYEGIDWPKKWRCFVAALNHETFYCIKGQKDNLFSFVSCLKYFRKHKLWSQAEGWTLLENIGTQGCHALGALLPLCKMLEKRSDYSKADKHLIAKTLCESCPGERNHCLKNLPPLLDRLKEVPGLGEEERIQFIVNILQLAEGSDGELLAHLPALIDALVLGEQKMPWPEFCVLITDLASREKSAAPQRNYLQEIYFSINEKPSYGENIKQILNGLLLTAEITQSVDSTLLDFLSNMPEDVAKEYHKKAAQVSAILKLESNPSNLGIKEFLQLLEKNGQDIARIKHEIAVLEDLEFPKNEIILWIVRFLADPGVDLYTTTDPSPDSENSVFYRSYRHDDKVFLRKLFRACAKHRIVVLSFIEAVETYHFLSQDYELPELEAQHITLASYTTNYQQQSSVPSTAKGKGLETSLFSLFKQMPPNHMHFRTIFYPNRKNMITLAMLATESNLDLSAEHMDSLISLVCNMPEPERLGEDFFKKLKNDDDFQNFVRFIIQSSLPEASYLKCGLESALSFYRNTRENWGIDVETLKKIYIQLCQNYKHSITSVIKYLDQQKRKIKPCFIECMDFIFSVENPELTFEDLIDSYLMARHNGLSMAQARQEAVRTTHLIPLIRSTLEWHLTQVHTDVERILPRIHTEQNQAMFALSLSEAVIFFRALPQNGDRNNEIYTLKRLALDVERLLNHDKRGQYFHDQIHDHPGPNNLAMIEKYFTEAKQGDNAALIAKLKETLALAQTFYSHSETFSELCAVWYPELAQRTELGVREAGLAAVEIRQRWDAGQIQEEHKRSAIQTLIALDQIVFKRCAREASREPSAKDCHDMAAQIRLLCGTGHGHAGWLESAEKLERLGNDWEQIDLSIRLSRFKTLAIPCFVMLEEFQGSYHRIFDASLAQSNYPPERTNGFCSTLYRATSAMQLGILLHQLGLKPGNRDVSVRVLELQAKAFLPIPWDAYFFGDTNFPADIRIVGGKADGLHYLRQNVPDHTQGFVLPVRSGLQELSASDKTTIRQAIAELEKRTSKKFGKDLTVSVRSGAAISMPGTMDTVLNVGDWETLFASVQKVYKSWDSASAVAYRERNGIPHDWATAVSIVEMVDGTKDDQSGSGVASSIFNLTYGSKTRGDALVDGSHSGSDILNDKNKKTITGWISQFERDLHHPVELEFTIESGKVYLLQIRKAHLDGEQLIHWYDHAVENGILTKEEARQKLSPLLQTARFKTLDESQINKSPLVENMTGHGQAITGEIARNAEQIEKIQERGAIAVLVTDNPDAHDTLALALKCGGLIVCGGNQLAHLFDVARDMNIPFIFGLPTGREPRNRLRVYSKITLDPRSGRIFRGHLPLIARNLVPRFLSAAET